ncbi:MAG: PDZ domain-containing protein [Campylobacterota bacterium]
MIKFSSSRYLRISIKVLILLLIAKFLSLIFWLFLPSDGVDLIQKESYQHRYQKVDFQNMIKNSNSLVKNEPIENGNSFSGLSITNMVLKGLYGTSSGGYVIVSLKISPKSTSIIGVGESFSGFTLKSIRLTSAIFVKDGTEYILELEKIKKSKNFIKGVENTVSVGNSIDVSRNDISFYTKNPKEVWKDISFSEVRNGRDIEGFRVTKINSNSKLATLGLKKGDLIIKANNIELKSYKDILGIYSNIDKLKRIQVVVMRNNQEKELVYEIN